MKTRLLRRHKIITGQMSQYKESELTVRRVNKFEREIKKKISSCVARSHASQGLRKLSTTEEPPFLDLSLATTGRKLPTLGVFLTTTGFLTEGRETSGTMRRESVAVIIISSRLGISISIRRCFHNSICFWHKSICNS